VKRLRNHTISGIVCTESRCGRGTSVGLALGFYLLGRNISFSLSNHKGPRVVMSGCSVDFCASGPTYVPSRGSDRNVIRGIVDLRDQRGAYMSGLRPKTNTSCCTI